MALSMNEVFMNKPVPMRWSALLTLAALLPMTATPLLAHEYRGDDGRNYYDGRDDYGRRAYGSGRDYENSREYLYRPNGVAQRAAWDEPGTDTNSCVEGSVIGGLLGAGLGAVLSRGNGRWIGVPVGGAAGALIGCQVDGG
ncbi:Glycine zipper 2TM domain protein [Synechococcus sp. MIT S9509]|nr:Glycine zipper 2TM domain protein [Synechococcus sp. MIT S9504]KZR92386.1 Glycine zipper 2TM domain protein [Synechococcus sp. MIT S9509]